MPRRPHCVLFRLLLAALSALTSPLHGQVGKIKEAKVNNSKATVALDFETIGEVDLAAPGRDDKVRVRNGTSVDIDMVEVKFGSLELLGGAIKGVGSNKLKLMDSATVSVWSSGDFTDVAVVETLGFSIETAGGKKLNNSKLILTGATAFSADLISTANGGEINNALGGVFSVTGLGSILHDSSGLRAIFKNDGTYTKASTSTGLTEIDATFNNSNTVNVNAGALKLKGGGASSGNVTVAAGAALQMDSNATGSAYAFTGGALGGTGIIELQSGTTSFAGTTGSANIRNAGGHLEFAGAHSTTGYLELRQGSVSGNGNATVGSLTWDGGDITGTTITTNATGSSTIGGFGNKHLAGGAQLNLAGTTVWGPDGEGQATNIAASGSSTKLRNTGTITITSHGTIGGYTILTGCNTTSTIGAEATSADRATFRNEGTLRKAGTAGATKITTRFENTSVVDVETGTLEIQGGGASSGGMMKVSNGANIVLHTNDYAFTNTTLSGNATGAGLVEITGNTTTFNATSGNVGLKVTGGTAHFTGAHAGTGSLTLDSGSVTGTGTAEFGAFTWNGGSLDGKIKSNTAVSISGDAKTIGAAGELILNGTASISANLSNQGRFSKDSAGTTEIQTIFDSSGTLSANAGTLKLAGGGKSSNAISIGSGAKLEIGTTNYTFDNANITSTGTGELEVTGATATFKGASANGKVSANGGNIIFDTTLSTFGTLAIANGTVSANSTGSANVTTLDWTGGTLGANLVANGSSTLGGGLKNLSGQLTLAGNTTWDGSQINATGSGKIKNEAGKIFTATGDGIITNAGSGGFENLGTFAASGNGTTEIQTSFTNPGTLTAASGTVKLSGGGSSSGNIVVGNGAKVRIEGKDFSIAGATLSGANGKLDLAGNVTTFSSTTTGDVEIFLNGGTAKFDGMHNGSGKLSLTSGALTGNGTADFGSVDWSGGTLNAKVKANGATNLSGGPKSLTGELTLAGNTIWDGSQINGSGSAKIKNESNFVASGDGTFANSGGATFTNHGTFTKANNGVGSTRIEALFDNHGTVNVDGGKLVFAGGGKNSASILVAAAGLLEIAGDLELTATSVLSGNGLGRIVGGTLSAHGTVSLKNIDFAGGKLAGTNVFTGSVEWTGGDWNSSAGGVTTTIAAGGVLNLRGSNSDFNQRSIQNNGTVNWHGGNLRGGSGGVFDNHSVFNDLAVGNKAISSQGGLFAFTNHGLYNKSASGTTNVEVPFTNHGTVQVSAGTLAFGAAFSNNGALQLANGATAQFFAPITFGANMPLTGSGTISAPGVSVGGTIAPGTSPGTLTITGDLTLLGASSLLIELGGTTPGVNHDFLSVSGAAVLGGNLQVSFINGFQWTAQPTQQFTILTASSVAGVFANAPTTGFRMTTFDGAGSFQVNYGLNNVMLSNFIVTVPEPSTYAMIGIGAVAVLFSLRRRRK